MLQETCGMETGVMGLLQGDKTNADIDPFFCNAANAVIGTSQFDDKKRVGWDGLDMLNEKMIMTRSW